MPTKTFKTIAAKAGKSVADMERYWKSGVESAKRQIAKGKDIDDIDAYAMAVTLRRCKLPDGKGDPTKTHRPHYPAEPANRRRADRKEAARQNRKKKKESKEGFEGRIDIILENLQGSL